MSSKKQLGDKIFLKFNLKNSGTLAIQDVVMKIDYTVNDALKNKQAEERDRCLFSDGTISTRSPFPFENTSEDESK
ncbi:hypothetical protein D0437_30420 [Bacillus cereus]|uniref:Uncharacterized protein n=1 Tax=Bacillus cereus TaxID=1396 RepID=A0A9X7QN51_BACCE|nr:TasA family protein [Bacillus cereus]QDZ77066.1 hypothetical protein D0437_30420 [Bacillus cereus]